MTALPIVGVADAATRSAAEVLGNLDSAVTGLADDTEAARRRVGVGPNAVRTHRVSAVAVLVRQLRSALLWLLAAAAIVSYVVGERTDAVVIAVILTVSVGLGFANEYRAERAGAALHDTVRHQAVVVRGGIARSVDVVDLVPGDVVRLDLGMVVPADIRLLAVEHLQCDESILTGEAAAATKTTEPTKAGTAVGDLGSCALMGTIVRAGSGTGVVVATVPLTAFGRIAVGLSHRQPDTEFQAGLRRFSLMLAWTAGVLTTAILVINVLLDRPLIDAVLFSLAIAVGITPQLLPAVVDDEPRRGHPGHGRPWRSGQAAGVRGRHRQRRGAVHRQDGHADRRPHQPAPLPVGQGGAQHPPAAAGAAGQPGHGAGRRRRRRKPAGRGPVEIAGQRGATGRRLPPDRAAALRPPTTPGQRSGRRPHRPATHHQGRTGRTADVVHHRARRRAGSPRHRTPRGQPRRGRRQPPRPGPRRPVPRRRAGPVPRRAADLP